MMYFHSVHGKNIQLSADNSQARRISGFCQGITFSNNPLTQLQRVTFVVANDFLQTTCDSSKNFSPNNNTNVNSTRNGNKSTSWKNKSSMMSSSSSMWTGNLRIGVTTKNPTSLISTELPEFSYPTLLNTDGFWITCIKSSYLKTGNKISLVLDKNNCLQLAINYVVKATLFGNNMIPNTPQTKLWLVLDIYGATNFVQFLPSDETPYEIKERGLDAINNFHSACLTGGSKSIYKTRLLILGQDDVGKSCLKNSLVDFQNRGKSSSKQKQLDLSASFRVKIDSKSNWHLKAILNNERNKKKFTNKMSKHLSQSVNSLDQMNRLSSSQPINEAHNTNSDSAMRTSTTLEKRKSSSTSYLNEEDDYDDDYENSLSLSMKHQFKQQLHQMQYQQEQNEGVGESPATRETNNEELLNQQQQKSIQNNLLLSLNLQDASSKTNGADGESSSSSSEKDSDEENDDIDADLYAIDENDEVFSNVDYESNDLKKDPSGQYYKKIAMNIYRELYLTKLWDKLWPKSTTTVGGETINTNGSMTTSSSMSNELKIDEFPVGLFANNSPITDSIFEKIALMEFEASIYNQLPCSKMLLFYFQRIIGNEIKTLRSSKPSRTILVSPVEKKETSEFFSNWMGNSENLKLMRKRLSLTICDLADQSYRLLLSSRAVYIVCVDLTKNLEDLSETSFEYCSKKNEELTNIDYLDLVFKSIHYNTAKITNMPATIINPPPAYTNSNVSSLVKLKSEEDEKSQFKAGIMSPPILLVGTNKTSLPKANRAELIKKKFDQIREFTSNKIYSSHILEPYFAIDNNNKQVINEDEEKDQLSDDASDDIELLKRHIQLAALSEPYMGEQLPLKWMNFDKSLEKLKNKGLFYASLSQICEIAHEKDINTQEELTTCLNFLNDLGQIIYYGNANDIFLRNTIILRPQKLIEIFNLVMDAKTPSVAAPKPQIQPQSQQQNGGQQKWLELWENFDERGILHDRLLDVFWKEVISQKPGLLGLMKKFDLICERSMAHSTPMSAHHMAGRGGVGSQYNSDSHLNREYLVPSRAKVIYDEEEAMTELLRSTENTVHVNNGDDEDNDSDNSDYGSRGGTGGDYDDSGDMSCDSYRCGTFKPKKKRPLNNGLNVEFYYDFCGFLPESLFHRIITRTARWTLMKSGANPKIAVSMYYRKARFYLDVNHFFTIEMMPLKYARIKIEIIRLNLNTHGFINDPSPPDPNACAKVRNFMETTLIDLRNLWMKRLMFYACVQCSCDKLCDLHQLKMCNDLRCMHFLNLDECLTNNIVTCDYRRVKTLVYKSWFPTQNISLHKGPVLAAVKTYSDKNMFYEESSLPSWIKTVAKLLQTYGKEKDKEKEKENQIVTVHNENDWLALARLLGYSKSKINYFNESENPALQLICDWIMSSDNTNLTIEFLLNYLEQIKREDVIKIINNEREKETVNSSIFLSYQWDSQEIVIKIKEHLEKAGFNCFMDIGQIGGGNLLYQKIDQAIRNAKVVIACVTPKFVVSHYCNREMALADLLHKPIVPVMLTATPWPPPGGMGLIFSQLVYVDYFGVGGHGGCGINADREQRNNEIVAMCSRHINPSSYFLMNIDRLTDNDKSNPTSAGGQGRQKRNFLEQLKPSQLIRSSQYYNNGANNNNNTNGNQPATNGANNGGPSPNNNNNNRRNSTSNRQHADDVNVRSGNFFMQHQSHLINQQMAAQHQNGQRNGRSITINLNRSHPVDVATREVSRCSVCVLL